MRISLLLAALIAAPVLMVVVYTAEPAAPAVGVQYSLVSNHSEEGR